MATSTTTTLNTDQTLADLLADLGGIDPARVRLHPFPGTATEEDLVRVNELGRGLFELIDGALVEKGMGYDESNLAMLLGGFLNAFVIPRNLGIVTGADGLMRLTPGQVRIPDVAFASWNRFPGGRRSGRPIADFAPDLAIEVLSRSNTASEMGQKRRDYFAAGVRLVWEVDPIARVVTVYTDADEGVTLDRRDTLDGGDVLPGFALPLVHLFAELDRHADTQPELPQA